MPTEKQNCLVKILSPVLTKMSSQTASIVRPALSFLSVYYLTAPFGRKIRRQMKKSIILTDGYGYYFYTGLIPHVRNYLGSQGYNLIVQGDYPILPFEHPHLDGIEFEPEQERLILSALNAKPQRGIIKGFTGVGKTLMGVAFCKSLGNTKNLWLCHTKDLMRQTAKVFTNFGFEVGLLGDGESNLDRQVTVATRQSFVKLLTDETKNLYDVLVLDEVHHLSKIESQYGDVLRHLMAPVRLGLTATTPNPDEKESWLTFSGLIGPILDDFSVQEGIAAGMAAKPRIRLIRVPKSQAIKQMKGKYSDIYQAGVVEREYRNRQIAEITKMHVEQGDSVLILVTIIEHGNNIQNACELMDFGIPFVHGQTPTEERIKAAEDLESKQILCLVASTIFKEGVNIRSLDVIINAAGGKGEIPTLQAIGRGLRVTPTKRSVTVYDFFDPSHKFFIEHFGERMCTYFDNGFFE